MRISIDELRARWALLLGLAPGVAFACGAPAQTTNDPATVPGSSLESSAERCERLNGSPSDAGSAGRLCESGASCEDDDETQSLSCLCQLHPESCVVGRPFLVAGVARTAEAVRRSGWMTDLLPIPELPEDPDIRAGLAAHWTHAGLVEHASIAAFARLALQLLAIGAPAGLVLRAAKAMKEEIRHAEISFSLASHYADALVGPGTLEVGETLGPSDLPSVTRLAIREGCVGETAAALAAAEGANCAHDSALVEILSEVARDEAAHAELAWSTVSWAATQDRQSVETIVRDELRALAAPGATRDEPVGTVFEAALARHGVLGAQRFRRIRSEAIDEIVRPLLQGMLLKLASASPPHASFA